MSWIPIAAKGGLTLAEMIAAALGVGAGVAGGVAIGKGRSGSSNIDDDGNIRLGGGGGSKYPKIRVSGGARIPTIEELEPYTDIGATVQEVSKAIAKLIGSTSSSIIRYKYKKGQTSNIGAFKDTLQRNPQFIEDIIDIVGKDRPKGTSSKDIIDIISNDAAKQKAFLDALKALKIPNAPTFTLGSGASATTAQPDGGGDKPPSTDSTTGKAKPKKPQQAGKSPEGGPSKRPENVEYDPTGKPISQQTGKQDGETGTGGKATTSSSGGEAQPKDPKKDKKDDPKVDIDIDVDDDDDNKRKKEPRPPPRPPRPDGDGDDKKSKVKERPIFSEAQKRRMTNQKWYPKYQFGGQDLLRLTEVEKLEELKNYTLFDLVTPLLAGDEDNLLALQNKIQENRRFTNTYPNPKPEPRLPPPPDVTAWGQPMKSVYPVPYPMSLDQPQAQNYYDHFDNQDYRYLNKRVDRMAQGGTMDPDMQKVLNNKRDSFTATDNKVMKHDKSKLSLLEDIDSGSVTQLDLMLLR
jgi:hypothetical protein